MTSEAESVLAREAELRAAASDAALARHARRVRRQRLIHYPVVGVLVLALAIVFFVAYLHGEAHNTRSIAVADAPAPVQLHTPAADQDVVWRTADHAALGTPQYSGTVVVYDKHTVLGRNARTGKQTWSYYRSDRTVCSAIQVNGIAVAVYELAGNCDELSGLNAGTGRLEWTRTLDFNGEPLFGRPTYQVDDFTSFLLITSPTVIYGIEVGTGENGAETGFVYSHFGCRINGAVVGSAGALISQTCTKPRCQSLSFCGKGPQLLLRGDIYDGVNDSSTKNPDRILWNRLGNTDVPVSAGSLIAAGNTTTGDLDILGAKSGKLSGSVPLGGAGADWTSSSVAGLPDGNTLVWTPSSMASVDTDGTRSDSASWTAPSIAQPAAAGGTVTQATASGARLLDARSGTVQGIYPLSPVPPAGGAVYRLGAGFLVASPTGTVAYG